MVKLEEDRLVTVVKVYKMVDGTQQCAVGFLPKALLRTKELYVNKVLLVVEDLRGSDNTMIKKQNYRFRGIVKCKLLEAIEEHFRH